MTKRTHALVCDVLQPMLTDRGFTYVQHFILPRLRNGIAVNPKHIASQLRYDSVALTRAIDQLERRGLLERVRRDRDRRKVCLRLTPAACDTVDRLAELMHDRLDRLPPPSMATRCGSWRACS